MRSTGGSRRRARAHASLQKLPPPGESRLSSLRRRRIVLLTVAAALVATSPATAQLIPVKRLPKLVRLGFVRRVYPSLRFTLTLDRSPSLIGADVLHAATGARGQGVKIGVVDDGVDQTNPFFNPAGHSYPAGFPKGNTAF